MIGKIHSQICRASSRILSVLPAIISSVLLHCIDIFSENYLGFSAKLIISVTGGIFIIMNPLQSGGGRGGQNRLNGAYVPKIG